MDEQYKEGIARLEDFISSNEYGNGVCLICLEQIPPNGAVWTCRESCFCMLHLVCAQGWAAQQLKAAAAKATSQAANPDLYAPPPHTDLCMMPHMMLLIPLLPGSALHVCCSGSHSARWSQPAS